MRAGSFFAPAKLNLFLHVVGRRPDGYHLLETVFALLDFGDTIDVAVRDDGAIRRTRGLKGVAETDDLVLRAAHALKRDTGCSLGADLAVDKRIPVGGGLGGGSSDAATTLLALNRLWHLNLGRAELARIGLSLGADVPFFIFGHDAFARGIGEDLVAVKLPQRWFAVLAPDCAVPTAAIFGSEDLTRNTKSVKIEDFSAGFWSFPGNIFRNDLEPVACMVFPPVGAALDWLRGFDGEAAIAARMSGSGACVFSGFDSAERALAVLARRPPGIGGFAARSLGEHPLREYALG